MTKADILKLLYAHQGATPEEMQYIRDTIDFVSREEYWWQRTTLEGHLTGSAWILNEARDAALLLHHRKLNRWLQPGGHADADDGGLEDTARREAREETGCQQLKLLQSAIFDLDIHRIPAKGTEPEHLHYDVRFLFVATDGTMEINTAEAKGAHWAPLSTLTGEDTPLSLRRMALKTERYWRTTE
jgi:8-oxo-dGTP pyrophosphatase MutT (NUDIX family)